MTEEQLRILAELMSQQGMQQGLLSAPQQGGLLGNQPSQEMLMAWLQQKKPVPQGVNTVGVRG